METREWSIFDAISFGFKSFVKHISVFLGYIAVYLLVSVFRYIPIGFLNYETVKYYDYLYLPTLKFTNILFVNVGIFFIFSIFYYLFLVHYGAKLLKTSLDIYDGKAVSFGDFFRVDYNYFRYLWVMIAYTAVVVLGYIALIIPGIYLTLRYLFSLLFVIDKNLTRKESFKQSSILTDGHKWHLLGFFMIFFLIGLILMLFALPFFAVIGKLKEFNLELGSILQMIMIGIASFVGPIVMLAQVYIYRKLQEIKQVS